MPRFSSGVTLQQMEAELRPHFKDTHTLTAFAVSKGVSIEEIKIFYQELLRRISNKDTVYVDRETFRSLMNTQAHPERMPHIGAKQIRKDLAKAAAIVAKHKATKED